MPVKTRKIRGKLRTVEAATGRLAKSSKGNPRDGGGWPDTPVGRGKAGRQAGHINDSEIQTPSSRRAARRKAR